MSIDIDSFNAGSDNYPKVATEHKKPHGNARKIPSMIEKDLAKTNRTITIEQDGQLVEVNELEHLEEVFEKDKAERRGGKGAGRGNHSHDKNKHAKPPATLEEFTEPVYERQPGEDPMQYARFCMYRDFPANLRVLNRAWREIGEREHIQKGNTEEWTVTYNQNFYLTARNWFWKLRADAWDRYKEDQMRQIWIAREEERREANWTLGAEILAIVKDALPLLRSDGMDMVATPKGVNQLVGIAATLMKEAVPEIKLNGPDEISQLLDVLPPERAQKLRMMLLVERS